MHMNILNAQGKDLYWWIYHFMSSIEVDVQIRYTSQF